MLRPKVVGSAVVTMELVPHYGKDARGKVYSNPLERNLAG